MLTPQRDEATTRRRRYPVWLQLAIDAAVGMPRLVPVIRPRTTDVAAWVAGEYRSPRVWVIKHTPAMDREIDPLGRLCGWNGVDDLIRETTQNGKLRTFWYEKAIGTSATGTFWTHWFPVRGYPPTGSLNGTALTAVQHSDADQGAMQHGGNVSPDTKHLTSVSIRSDATAAAETCMALVYDLVLSYDNCAFSSGSQNFVNGVTAQRYISTGQPGLQIMPVITDVSGVVPFNVVTYTDNEGNSATVPSPTSYDTPSVGSTPTSATCWQSAVTVEMQPGTFRSILTLPLAAGDLGVRSLTNFTMNDATTGEMSFLLGYPLAFLPGYGLDYNYLYDWVKQIPALPRVFDGACLTFAVFILSNGGNYSSMLQVAWG